MKNVIIAIDDVEKFHLIKKCCYKTNYFVFKRDLLYEDAIFELIENDKYAVDVLIVKYNIIKDKKKFKKLLNKYNKIKCYIFVDNIEDVDKVKCDNYKNVYEYKELDSYLVNEKILNKSELTSNETVDKLKNIKKEFNNIKNLNVKFNSTCDAEIIVITGEPKVGKTTYICLMIEEMSKTKKILYTCFNNRYDKIVNQNLDEKLRHFNNVTCVYDIYKQVKKESLEKIYKDFFRNFDVIIIDLSYYVEFKYLKYILMVSKKIYFIVEPIYSEINKSLYMLEYFFNNKLINENENVFIIFNKYDYKSISIEILKEIFKKYKIDSIVKRKMKYRRILNKDINYGYRIKREC